MSSPEEGLVHPVRFAEGGQVAGVLLTAGYQRLLKEQLVAKQKPVDKGTKAETDVVKWARAHEFWNAERIAKSGSFDRGDVRICEYVMAQVKNGYTDGRAPTDYLIGQWLETLDKQVKNGGWHVGLLVHKRAGKGSPDAWRWFLTGPTFEYLARCCACDGICDDGPVPQPPYVQLQGYMVPPLLKNAGYRA